MEFFICKTLQATLSKQSCDRNRTNLHRCIGCSNQKRFQSEMFSKENILNEVHLYVYDTLPNNSHEGLKRKPKNIATVFDSNFTYIILPK